MTDRDALLRSICAEPGNDEHRIAFASWCQDEAREADRAEFVRCQVELSEIDREVTAGKRLGGYCPASPELMKGECPCSWHRLRRRERDLLEAHEWDWLHAIHPELQRGSHDASTGRTWWLRKPVWSRGFLKSLEIDWETFREIHAGLFWSPRQTVECPKCKGSGRAPFANEWQCWTCGKEGLRGAASGCIPRPFVPTAQPLETVRLTTWPSDGHSNSGALWFVASSGYRFDRVKCGVCNGRGIIYRAVYPPFDFRVPRSDVPAISRERVTEEQCSSCHSRPLNRWTCPEWPGLEFVMPE